MDSELRQRKKEKSQGESKGRKSPLSQKGSNSRFLIFLLPLLMIVVTAMHNKISLVSFFNTTPKPGRMVSVSFYGQQLHAVCSGPQTEGGVTVIFNSNFGGTFLEWKFVQNELLSQNIRSCAIDRLGNGWSSDLVSVEPVTIDSTNQNLNEAIEKLNIEKVILVGNGYGAFSSIAFANNYKDKVKGLIVIDHNYENLLSPMYLDILKCQRSHLVKSKWIGYTGFARYFPDLILDSQSFNGSMKLQHINFMLEKGLTTATLEIDGLLKYQSTDKNDDFNDIPIINVFSNDWFGNGLSTEELVEKQDSTNKFLAKYTNKEEIFVDGKGLVSVSHTKEISNAIVKLLNKVK